MAKYSLQGGAKLQAHLKKLARKLEKSGSVTVGVLENATYPAQEGQPSLHVAQVAFWNEFGTTTAPERPFFRNTIAEKSPEWGKDLAAILKHTKFDVPQAMAIMGERIKDQLVSAIVAWPADNAETTVEKKGFNKGLIDQGVLQRSIDYRVEK